MKTKVYCVMRCSEYDGNYLMDVCSSQYIADRIAQSWTRRQGKADVCSYMVVERELLKNLPYDIANS